VLPGCVQYGSIYHLLNTAHIILCYNYKMKLSVIIPSYNERKTLPEVLKAVSALPVDKEIIIVDDGSSDGTREWFESEKAAGRWPEARMIKHEKNQGKGGALITGFTEAQGHFVVVQDADLEYDPSQIPELLRPLDEGQTDAVFGSRMLAEKIETYSPLYLRGNRTMTAWINFLFGSRYTDSYTCYKLFRTSDARRMNLKSHGFEIEAEMACKAAFMGIRVMELPVIYRPRSREEGKKINFRDAIKGALKALVLKLTLRKNSIH